jgi:hypothetical protein
MEFFIEIMATPVELLNATYLTSLAVFSFLIGVLTGSNRRK